MSTQQNDQTPVLFPVSMWVTGDMHELKDKTDNNKQPRVYAPTHKKAGQVMRECYFGIAIRKAPGQTHWAVKPADWDQTNPGVQYWGEAIWLVGNAAFPALCNNPQKYITLPTFAWKIEDGDDTTPKGEKQVRNCDKPGHPGNWIVHLKTWKVPSVHTQDGMQVLADRSIIKRGYYIQVFGSVSGNGQPGKPGVYINHDLVAYVPTEGAQEIRGSSGDATKVGFGRGALPSGVVAAPLSVAAAAFAGAPGLPGLPGALPPAGLPAVAAGLPGVPAGLPVSAPALPAVTAPGLPAGFPSVTAAPTFPSNPVAVTPQLGFLNPPALALPPVVPQQPVLNPQLAAAGHTWAALQAGGWTLEAARAAGHVIG